ncbi:MAG: EamA family transporter [Hymenobacteraceae bacterium]|nr:EamA family transporter [Hymenobacteraceae bacterium]
MWIVFSLLAAFTAAVVVTLTKLGVQKVAPALAFAVQAVLILIVSWAVAIARGGLPEIARIDQRSWTFLIIAGVLTTCSSLFSFQAIKLGPAAGAGTLDKVSLVFVLILAAVFLKEKMTWQIVFGAGLMLAGAVVIAFSRAGVK